MESNTNVDKDKKSNSSEEKSVSDLCCCYVIDQFGISHYSLYLLYARRPKGNKLSRSVAITKPLLCNRL